MTIHPVHIGNGTGKEMDVLVTRDMTNRAFRTEVFRKPTHTDWYLHFDSYMYHHAHVKTGIIRTL